MGPDDDSRDPGSPDQGNPAPVEPEVQQGTAPAAPTRPVLRRGLGNRKDPTPGDEVAAKNRAERVERVGDLLRQGWTKRAIARELQVDESTVRADVKRWVEVNPSPNAAEVRAREDHRLERLYRSLDTARVQVDAVLAVAAGAIRRSVDATTGVPSLDWADKLDSLHEAVNDLGRITGRSVQVSESIRTLHGVDAPRQVHVTSESTSEVVHHVVPVSIDECLRVMAANTGVPALPAAVDEAPPRSIQ